MGGADHSSLVCAESHDTRELMRRHGLFGEMNDWLLLEEEFFLFLRLMVSFLEREREREIEQERG